MRNQIEFRQDVLCMEYEKCIERIIYLDGQANKGVDNIFLALGIMVAVLSLVFNDINKENVNLIFVFIIFGCSVINFLIILAFHHTIQIYRLAGYIKYLECEINKYTNDIILKWENNISQKFIHKTLSVRMLYILISIFYICITGIGLYLCFKFLLIFSLVLGIIFLFIFIIELITAITYGISSLKVTSVIYNAIC